jgi:hypothetical protein
MLFTDPTWPWQNLSAALATQTSVGGFQALANIPATCFYFVYSIKKAGAPGPYGFITNAVGGTTIAAWSDSTVLDACPNSTYPSSVASPHVLFNGMTAPFINTTLSGIIWYQGKYFCYLGDLSDVTV